MPDDLGVRITQREVYDAVQAIGREVAALRLEVQAEVASNRDLTKRVRSLELKFYGVLAGLIGAVGALVAGVVRR